MNRKTTYVDVILPLPVDGHFCYTLNNFDCVDIGQRVVVQFGVRKIYTAIVIRVHHEAPLDYIPKEVLEILDEDPIIHLKQLDFWKWISEYYMCEIGNVMNAALPSSFKLASETSVLISSKYDGEIDSFDEIEKKIIETLVCSEEMTLKRLAKFLNLQNIFPLINELIRKEVVILKEDLNEKYRKKYVNILKLNISEVKNLTLTKKQESVLNTFVKNQSNYSQNQVVVSDFLKNNGFTRSVLNRLISKKIFSIDKILLSRLNLSNNIRVRNLKLSLPQAKAFDEINNCFLKDKVCLLHGVTSSGKTEIYIKLIEEYLKKGKQILYLLPEIALTTQIIQRLKDYFGKKVLVYHSNLSNSERVEVWQVLRSGEKRSTYPIVLGTRSSIFLPFSNLGLIIVDEEHDSSYKQIRPSPRYHARDSAIYLSKLHRANILLGSATPSVESYHNTIIEKYALVSLNVRYNNLCLPSLKTIDVRKSYLKKTMTYQFSAEMLEAIKNTLSANKQVILFHNRRGYSPMISCSNCFYIPQCVSCDVSLTYHKWNEILKCHYCGYSQNLNKSCPKCGSLQFDDKGFGTEQVQESLKQVFPNTNIKRLDYDTTRKKNNYQKIINEFEKGRIKILIGTQMITKGLDFDNVMLVGILNADSMLYFPDFRANERAFQIITQVAGRSGRKNGHGKVLVQTYDETHYIFPLLRENNYLSFIKKEIKDRERFSYPPFYKLIRIKLSDLNKQRLDYSSKKLADAMRKFYSDRVLGPEYPYVSKIRKHYQKEILLKIEKSSSYQSAKSILKKIIDKMNSEKKFRATRKIIDVDCL